jgi:nitrogen fixation protein NifQ
MQSAEALHDRLMAGAAPDCDPFDAHVLACILAIGAHEAQRARGTWTEAVGLDPEALARLLARYFPGAEGRLPELPVATISVTTDEACLVDLLRQAATSGALASEWLAPMIARRAQRPDHLWQDLGLHARTELSALMNRHFRVLAARNTRDMKWKKYLYRTICGDTGYALCSAPSCAECADFDHCFGDESGESFLARARRNAETSA